MQLDPSLDTLDERTAKMATDCIVTQFSDGRRGFGQNLAHCRRNVCNQDSMTGTLKTLHGKLLNLRDEFWKLFEAQEKDF